MTGYVDLHSHFLPGIDDGVRSLDEGISLCRELSAIGFDTLTATPHIRTSMFPNEPERLIDAFASFREQTRERIAEPSPTLGLGAEHFFDDVFWTLFAEGRAVRYPGGQAMLVELPPDLFPLRLADRFFEMRVRGVRPVLAHPERYSPLHQDSSVLEQFVQVGVLPLLDVMSLVGRYGRRAERAAERILDENLYFGACSDAHRPADAAIVERGIQRLDELVGRDKTRELLDEGPRAVISGAFDA